MVITSLKRMRIIDIDHSSPCLYRWCAIAKARDRDFDDNHRDVTLGQKWWWLQLRLMMLKTTRMIFEKIKVHLFQNCFSTKKVTKVWFSLVIFSTLAAFTRWVIAGETNWSKLGRITIKSGQNRNHNDHFLQLGLTRQSPPLHCFVLLSSLTISSPQREDTRWYMEEVSIRQRFED